MYEPLGWMEYITPCWGSWMCPIHPHRRGQPTAGGWDANLTRVTLTLSSLTFTYILQQKKSRNFLIYIFSTYVSYWLLMWVNLFIVKYCQTFTTPVEWKNYTVVLPYTYGDHYTHRDPEACFYLSLFYRNTIFMCIKKHLEVFQVWYIQHTMLKRGTT
jgi:hypothetical protein